MGEGRFKLINLNQCQQLTEELGNELLKLLQKIKEFFDGTLVTWKVD